MEGPASVRTLQDGSVWKRESIGGARWHWVRIEGAYVPSAEELRTCMMVRFAIEMCASRAEGGCMDCPHDETCDAPCVLRHYLCRMRQPDAWDMEDKPLEFEPCLVCGGTDSDYDGFCPQCEIALEIKKGCSDCTGAQDGVYPHDECSSCCKYPHQEGVVK